VIEQRKARRFDVRLPVELLRCGRNRIHHSGETRNVSSSGVLFSADTQFGIGEPVEYVITFPSDSPKTDVRLRCLGTVVRSEDDAAAVTLDRYEFVRESR
jgi:hypothetical protein